MPIFITEGVKKAASILSSGRVAIGPPGTCRSIFRSDSTDVNHRFEVSTEIKQFIDKSNKRLFYIVFDRDHDPVLHEFVKSNAKVLAQMLTELNMDVKIIDLPEDTKGVDDYIYKYGQNAFNHTLVKDAKNYIDWLELNSNLLSADQIAKNEWCFNPCQGSCALKTKLEEK